MFPPYFAIIIPNYGNDMGISHQSAVKGRNRMDELSARAIAAKDNEQNFYQFAIDLNRFIKRCAFRTCRRFITESDDEWSIALIAFYEAVRSFDGSKGAFKSFASVVIRRRLMDYFDSQSRHGMEYAADPYTFDGQFDSEEATAFDLEVAERSAAFGTLAQPGTTSLEDEVEAVRQRIMTYGFDLHDIGGCSPKATKTKQACARVIDAIVSSDELFTAMRRKRNLPYTKLLALDGVNKKLLERHRKYLIVAAEIRRGDFPELAEYIVRL